MRRFRGGLALALSLVCGAARAQTPPTRQADFDAAWRAYQAGQSAEALAGFTRISQTSAGGDAINDPVVPIASIARGMIELHARGPGAAAAWVERGARALDRDDAPPIARGYALRSLAALREAQGRTDDALGALTREAAASEETLARLHGMTTSFLIAEVVRALRGDEDLAYSLALAHPGNAALVEAAASFAARRKGRAIDEASWVYQKIARLPAADARSIRLREALARLSTVSFAAGLPDAPPGLGARMAEMRREVDAAERACIAAASGFGDGLFGFNMPDLTSSNVPHVEYVRFQRYDAHSVGASPWREMRYGAFVTGSIVSATPGPRFVDLGAAAPIDAAVEALVRALRDPHGVWEPPSQNLYRLVMAPMVSAITEGGVEQLTLAPDGDLNLIPFDALYDGQQVLGARLQIAYVTSGRDLGVLRSSRARATTVRPDLVVFADPAFERPGTRGGLNIPTLPGTRGEARVIASLFPAARSMFGDQATEASLLGASAGVLHIATHGIYLDHGAAAGDGDRGLALVRVEAPVASPSAGDAPSQAPPRGVDPMYRSALLLARASGVGADAAALLRGDPVGDDGVVTAAEVTRMDLRGTQLAVLSACESGTGAVVSGEGVYGLRRAFFAAGADSLVTSLWEVDDTTTAELMSRFYGRLARGWSRSDALRGAALSMRRRWPHPYYWAPFVLIGEGRALEGIGERWDTVDPITSAPTRVGR